MIMLLCYYVFKDENSLKTIHYDMIMLLCYYVIMLLCL